MTTGNILLLKENLLDTATTLAATSAAASMPVSNLQHPFRSVPWRSASAADQNIDITLPLSLPLFYSAVELPDILVDDNPVANDEFGYACSISGNGRVLAVGARGRDVSFSSDGYVTIYDRVGSVWVKRSQVVTASDAGSSDNFGSSCALNFDGSILAVGATGWDDTYSSQGAVYIFDWNSGTSSWDQRAQIIRPGIVYLLAYFGSSCAFDNTGNVLAVGANGVNTSQGAVYLFDWNSGTSLWDQRADIVTASDAGNGDNFGKSCSLSGNGLILAVGAPNWWGLASLQGAIYLFDWNSGTSIWDQRTQVLTRDYEQVYLGSSCSLSENGLVLAAGGESFDSSSFNQGAAFLYDWNSGTLTWDWRQQTITRQSAASNQYFGSSCCLSGDGSLFVVGARGYASSTGMVMTYDIPFDAAYSHVSLIDHNLPIGALVTVTGWLDAPGGNAPIFSVSLDPWAYADGSAPELLGDGVYSVGSQPALVIDCGAVASAQFIRVTLSGTNQSYYQIGRLFVARAWQPTVNMDWRWSMSLKDNSKYVKSARGQKFGNALPETTDVNLALNWVDDADRDDLLVQRLKQGLRESCVLQLRPNGGADKLFMSFYGKFTAMTTTPDRAGNSPFRLGFEEDL